ncbi:MAG: uncharacterized protein KVP18_003117 [Porospora cf. gigantea A]|nr:MAG: hypothetical protein KVP18_003117 [Porospora cf. gigantea A]
MTTKREVKLESEPQEPNFEPSGLLAKEAGLTKFGVDLKYTTPLDGKVAESGWRLYIFKGSTSERERRVVKLENKDHFLFGKDIRVVDVPCLHPSISKQHAAIQFRLIDDVVVPYILDLESTNGTFLNDELLDAARYYEIQSHDKIRLGKSTREFVVLHDDDLEGLSLDMQDFMKSHLSSRKAETEKETQRLLAQASIRKRRR